MRDVYINATGVFLPNQPVSNEEMELFLGKINGEQSRAKGRVLDQNGIKTRYYAIDKNQETTHSNAELAVAAIHDALGKTSLTANDIDVLATGTTQGDLPVPGFGSNVHGLLGGKALEVNSFQSVCSSGVMALKAASNQLRLTGDKSAVCVGSELSSRLFKASRFEAQGMAQIPFDTEFLRWMLSDGAGAMVLQDKPNEKGVSLKVDWIDIKSHAHLNPLCMYVGANGDSPYTSWLDYPSYEDASKAGAINLKQNIRLLNDVVKVGVSHYFDLIDQGKVQVEAVDWLLCHYSSEYFKEPIKNLMKKGGGFIPEGKWFSNLTTKGNTGAASIYIMIDELLYSGKLKNGDRILCMVPESGQFISSFFQLTVVENGVEEERKIEPREISAPSLVVDETEVSEWLVRNLSKVWVDFEQRMNQVDIMSKMYRGKLTVEMYMLLLRDLRQQVIDGSQWITRAASNIDIELFELRSAFIRHAATEHKDYQLLEKNYLAMGGTRAEIESGQKNIGSVALSSFMFHQAGQRNPIDLLGAMYIIEGIGKRLAGYWGETIQKQLNLKNDQVSFFTYHGVADENHFHRLEEALNHPMMSMEVAQAILKTAKTTATLYLLQLDELGNY